MLELVDNPDLGSGALRRMGSSPFTRTSRPLRGPAFSCGRRDSVGPRYPIPKPLPSGKGLSRFAPKCGPAKTRPPPGACRRLFRAGEGTPSAHVTPSPNPFPRGRGLVASLRSGQDRWPAPHSSRAFSDEQRNHRKGPETSNRGSYLQTCRWTLNSGTSPAKKRKTAVLLDGRFA